jgi:CheY-like chemotaxis protein
VKCDLRVLIVEDDPIVRRAIENVVSSARHTTVCATSEGALRLLRPGRPPRVDAALVGVGDAGRAAEELLCALRAAAPRLLIIASAPRLGPSRRAMLHSLGVDRVIETGELAQELLPALAGVPPRGTELLPP